MISVGSWIARPALALSALVAVALPLAVWLDAPTPIRVGLTALFVLAVPGVPLAALLFRSDRVAALAMVAPISLAGLMLVSTAQAMTGWWVPYAAVSAWGIIGVALTVPAWSRVPAWSLPAWSGRPSFAQGARWALLGVAVALWVWAMAVIDLDAVGAWGLLAVLPWQYIAALVAVMAGAVWALLPGKPLPAVFLGVSAWALIAIITTTVSLADGGAVASTTYVHVGFAEAISRAGSVLWGMDARFSWPGFFAAAAMATTWAGLPDASALVVGYPALVGALLIPSLYLLGRAITGSARAAWLGVFVYACANWVQQDYFSPQSIATVFFVTILAVLVRASSQGGIPAASGSVWRRIRVVLTRTPGRPADVSARLAIAREAALFVVAAAMVVGHQLTPVALILVLAGLAVTGTIRSRTLWFGVGVVFAAWFAFGATDWWQGHLSVVINGFGDIGTTVDAGVVERLRGDPVYQWMQRVRIGWTAVIALAGAVGWILSARRFPLSGTAVMVVAPVLVAVAQPYGGEVVLRVFLYALPVLSVLVGLLLHRLLGGARVLPALALTIILVVAAMTGSAARGVNTAFERNPADTVAAARDAVTRMSTGESIWSLQTEGVLRATRVGEIREARLPATDDSPFERLLAADPDVIFFSTSRQAYEHLVNGRPADWFSDVEKLLLTTGRYEVAERTEHALVLVRVADPEEGEE